MSNNEQPKPIITKGFWLAGAFNVIGVLVFSKFFTNSLLSSLDPVVCSWLGLVSIMLWGFAYCSVAKFYQFVPYLLLVFFVEKMTYTAAWAKWLTANGSTLSSLFAESPLTATFYSIYGPGDFVFGLFFLWVAIKGFQKREPPRR
jgi:hypothetical protein